MFNTNDEVEILQTTKIQQLNRWDYDLELFALKSKEEIKELSEIFNLPGEKIPVIVERKPPTCYECGRNGKS